jgi:hypothetical protein
MTKHVTMTAGVSVVGEIEVYGDDGVTPFTGATIPNFTGGQPGFWITNFFINNTGNQPVNVYWNISSTSLIMANWIAYSFGYNYSESATIKYTVAINLNTTTPETPDLWSPNDYITPVALHLDVGEGRKVGMYLGYTGEPNTAELFSYTMSFYAQDS